MLVVPPMEGNRWWLMQIIDAWNDVPAAPGSRTHGDKGGNFALVGPNFKGTLPAELERDPRRYQPRRARRADVHRRPESDYAAVHKIQDQYQLIPLSQWKGAGTNYTPPASVPSSRASTPRRRFRCRSSRCRPISSSVGFANCWSTIPPREADAPVMARLAKLGITARREVHDRSVRRRHAQGDRRRHRRRPAGDPRRGVEDGRDGQRLADRTRPRPLRNQVHVSRRVDVLRRRRQPRRGCDLSADRLTDSDGQKLTGANNYELRFAKDQIPPVDAFWSITLYDKDSYLVDNSINRYALGDRSGMKLGDDGSLTIYLQSESPGTESPVYSQV